MIPNLTIHWLDARNPNLKSGKIWLHALLAGEIVGQLSITPIEREWALIGDLFVPSNWRRQGVAAELLDDAERGAKNTSSIKLAGMAANVRRNNERCLALFYRRGYRHVFTNKGGDTLLLSKRLELKT